MMLMKVEVDEPGAIAQHWYAPISMLQYPPCRSLNTNIIPTSSLILLRRVYTMFLLFQVDAMIPTT